MRPTPMPGGVEQFGHAGFIFDVHFSRFGFFLVLRARNGVLAREIEPSE